MGRKTVEQILPDALPDKSLDEEGHAVKVVAKNGVMHVVAAGNSPRGTKAALGVLMKAIRVEDQDAFVPASLNVVASRLMPCEACT